MPLTIIADGSTKSGVHKTNSTGEYPFTHIANFSTNPENFISVSIQSTKALGRANFIVKKTPTFNESDSSNVAKGWGTDLDPIPGAPGSSRTVPSFLELVRWGNGCWSAVKSYNYKVIAVSGQTYNTGCKGHNDRSTPSENLSRDGYVTEGASFRASAWLCDYAGVNDSSYTPHGMVYDDTEVKNVNINFTRTGIISFQDSHYKSRFFYVETSDLSQEGGGNSYSRKRTVVNEARWKNPDTQLQGKYSEMSANAGHGARISESRSTTAYYRPWIFGYDKDNFNSMAPGDTIAYLGSGSYDIKMSTGDSKMEVEIRSIDRSPSSNIVDLIMDGDNHGTDYSFDGFIYPKKIGFKARRSDVEAKAEILIITTYTGVDENGGTRTSTIGTDKYEVHIPASSSDQPFVAPVDESTGPRYRKISLSGRPMSDDKPQMESEDDVDPVETYVDALSVQLRHDAVDISVAVPASEMNLSLRRNYKPLVWNLGGGLRPHESPENAFGGNWSTNVVSYLRKEIQEIDANDRKTPDTASVVDENGSSFSYVMLRPASASVLRDIFYPRPSGRSEQQSYLNTLTEENGYYVLRKRFGTTLYYTATPSVSQGVSSDRIWSSSSGMRYIYYRLERVVDRNGNEVVYDYPFAGTLIPSRVYVNGRPDICIRIEQSGGLIRKAWDAEGNEISYSYDSMAINASGSDAQTPDFPYVPSTIMQTAHVSAAGLSSVSRGGVAVNSYEYNGITAKRDTHSFLTNRPRYNFHVNLGKIADATGKEWTFTQGGHLNIRSFDSRIGDYVPNDRPMLLKTVTLPDETIVSFASTGVTNVGAGPMSMRQTDVIDADGNKVVYKWNGAEVEVMPDLGALFFFRGGDPFQKEYMVYYPNMVISHYEKNSGGVQVLLGEEKFTFDIDAGMALKEVVDFSGNKTEYVYNDSIPEIFDPKGNRIAYASKFSDPNIEKKFYGVGENDFYSKSFTYSPNFRIMDSSTDELGRVTKWTIDALGRRTAEHVYANASASSNSSNAVKETLFEYDSNWAGFLAKTTITDGAGDGKNMVTRNVPDSYGRVAASIADPDGLDITTKFEYNRNGRRTLATDPNGNSTRYEFDNFNRLVKVVNPDVSTREIFYDLAGRKIEERLDKNSVGDGKVRMRFEYNINGLQNRVQQVLGSTPDDNADIIIRTEYSSAGKILKSTDANGNDTLMKYDGMGRLLKLARYEGSAPANADSQVSSVGVYVTSYKYEGNVGSGVFSTDKFKPSEVTDANGNTSKFFHDAFYRETAMWLPYYDDFSKTYYEYDAVGNKISEINALGYTTSFEYDALNNLTRTIHPLLAGKSECEFTQASYSSAGLMLTVTDEMGNTSEYVYDNAGRKIETKLPEVYDGIAKMNARPAEKYRYDNNGNLIAKWDATNRQFNTVYDSRNRAIAELAPAVNDAANNNTLKRPTTVSKYDYVGNVVETIDANGNVTNFEFDNVGRTVKITFPEVMNGIGPQGSNGPTANPIEQIRYDGNGNIIAKTNPRGIVAETTYNAYNKPLVVTKNATFANSNGKIVEQYAYDFVGNPTIITDGRGVKTRYEYDMQDRRTRVVYGFETATTRIDEFAYDKLNMTVRKGVALTYDARNRLVIEGGARTYAYDAVGRILGTTEINNQKDVSVLYTYDALGKILSETNSGKTHQYVYDLTGRQVNAVYGMNGTNFSHTLATAYDAAGRIASITDNLNRKTQYAYDLNGNVVLKTNPNGNESISSYDALNRLSSREDLYNKLKLAYYYDLGGNVVRAYDGYGNYASSNRIDMHAGYDAFDRLKNYYLYDGTMRQYTYTYDAAGNRLTEYYNHGGSGAREFYSKSTTYNVNSLNQINSLRLGRQNYVGYYDSSPTGAPIIKNVVFSYSSRGNMTAINDDTTLMAFEYDQFDMLAKTFENGIEKTSNAYDYRGRRLSHANGNKTTTYYYSGGTSASQSEMTGTTGNPKTTLFYRGSDMGGGVGGINYAELDNGTDLNYKFYNLRGDVILTLDNNNNVKSKSMYTAFGTHEDNGVNNTDSHRANTKVEDTDNLLNEGKRFRHLEYAVFLTPDPLEYVDGLNSYIYVSQNPWGKFDALGLFGHGQNDAKAEILKKIEKNKKWVAPSGPNFSSLQNQFLEKELSRVEKDVSKGHSDFHGSDRFDFTLEDKDPKTAPLPSVGFFFFETGNPAGHFQDLETSEKQVAEAINSGNKDAFQRAMHRGQDFYSHYNKGYRWNPEDIFEYDSSYNPYNYGMGPGPKPVKGIKKNNVGHLFDGTAPDNDPKAWSEANEWTKKWVEKWDRSEAEHNNKPKEKKPDDEK